MFTQFRKCLGDDDDDDDDNGVLVQRKGKLWLADR